VGWMDRIGEQHRFIVGKGIEQSVVAVDKRLLPETVRYFV